MSNREQAKDTRRRRIVRAARVLMQKTGDTGFSMRALADEAGVSIATPYNLFGSKQSIMFAVLDADLEQYQRRLAKLRVDELDVFFKAVTLTTSLFSTEPAFYRAVLFAVYNDGGREFRSMFGGPRHAMWKGMVQDAVGKGARLETGGHRVGNKGYFYEPTVVSDVPKDARAMNEEPFGPLALISRFSTLDEVTEEANRLPYGLASYAFTSSTKTATAIGAAIESGMVSINSFGLALPEVPFGGVKDSGYGSEGGTEAMDGYFNTKFITQTGV